MDQVESSICYDHRITPSIIQREGKCSGDDPVNGIEFRKRQRARGITRWVAVILTGSCKI
jgi:hypothetical protein